MSAADPNPSISSLIGGLASDIQRLVRGEIALAKTELDQKISKAASTVSPAAAGLVIAFGGFVVTLGGIAIGVSYFIPPWLAFLVVGVVAVLVGGLISRAAIRRLSEISVLPARTADNLQKDADMLKEHL